MEEPLTLGKFNGIPQGIEGEASRGKKPESQDAEAEVGITIC
jgi:hypothetical protein